jgi:MGT family glycosyltransferase
MMMKGLPGIVERFRPDLIINDCISFAGALCAYEMGIPYVTTTPVPPDVMGSAMDMPKIREWQERMVFGLQREFGIDTDMPVIHSGQMNIVFTSREFADMADPSPTLKFVGPVRGRPDEGVFDWEWLERSVGPRIFISLGTLLVDIRKAFFRKMVEAFADQRLTVVAATDPAVLEVWPDNFIVQAYVPQSRVMEKMDAVICHGGFNTVNDAILNALPILITPIAYDHFHTASLVEKAGCGLSIRYRRMRVGDLQLAVSRLLEDVNYRLAAGRMRDSFLRSGGSEKAAELLEECI